MNFALIFAGGTGTRMHTKTKPKQFLELNGKPIIIHTIEHFESHPDIDGIIVVCVNSWISYLNELLEKFHIKKVKKVIPGGETGQESIFLGLCCIENLLNKISERDLVLVHDGVRPLIDSELISQNIACAKKYGNAITISTMIETEINVNEQYEIIETIDRERCRNAKAPQTFHIQEIIECHKKARREGRAFIDCATMMAFYGRRLYTVSCGTENIKITTPADFYIFRAICEAKENSQIWGI